MTENSITTTKKGLYTLARPSDALAIPLILDSPHSGRIYPDDFITEIAHNDLICGEDRFVDHLFGHPETHGITWLCAEFPRCYIDVNRHFTDIHPRLVKGKWDGDFPLLPTEKSSGGIGLIRETFHNGKHLYKSALPISQIKHRLDSYYSPYHDALAQEISRLKSNFGRVFHLNCHSMPSSTAPKCLSPSILGSKASKKADIVLGNRDGQSASQQFTDMVSAAFTEEGFSVMLNTPYKGVEIVQRYGLPNEQQHSVQIEINRGLYLDKDEREKNENFEIISTALQQVVSRISHEIQCLRD